MPNIHHEKLDSSASSSVFNISFSTIEEFEDEENSLYKCLGYTNMCPAETSKTQEKKEDFESSPDYGGELI